MNSWQPLQEEAKLEKIKEASFQKPQLIFKHSVTCGISAQVEYQLQSASEELSSSMDLHHLDLLRYRSISNKVSTEFGVVHQSPQVLLIKDGQTIYHSSHFAVRPEKIMAALA